MMMTLYCTNPNKEHLQSILHLQYIYKTTPTHYFPFENGVFLSLSLTSDDPIFTGMTFVLQEKKLKKDS